jgi:hypothetical protein
MVGLGIAVFAGMTACTYIIQGFLMTFVMMLGRKFLYAFESDEPNYRYKHKRSMCGNFKYFCTGNPLVWIIPFL